MNDLKEIEKKIPEKNLKSAKIKIKFKKTALLKKYLHINNGPGFMEYIEFVKSISDGLINKYSTKSKSKSKKLSLWS